MMNLAATLAMLIKTILYALEVDKIILGGSVRHAYPFFEKGVRERLKTFCVQTNN